MKLTCSINNSKIAYNREGSGDPVVLLHGWPGDSSDYELLAPLLIHDADVIVPDLLGFGDSDKPDGDAEEVYSASGQASVISLFLDELGVHNAVLCGYDVGSLVAQTIARSRPDLVRSLVISPPIPGAGKRVLELSAVKEFWYTSFHQLQLAEELIDGNVEAVRAYLRHFWEHWSGPNFVVEQKRLDRLVKSYSVPGAFSTSRLWYRSSSNPVNAYVNEKVPEKPNRLSTPATILWQEHDPIFPIVWSDRIDEFFANYTLEKLPGVGHFTPLEATERFASAIRRAVGRAQFQLS